MAVKLDEARVRLLKMLGNVEPSTNNSFNLGTSSYKWKNVYATTFTGALSGNAATATKLATARKIFNRSFDGTADIAGKAMVYGTYSATASSRYNYTGLEVRENDLVLANQSDIGYAPQIGFHWGNRVAATFLLHSDGNFYLRKQDGVTRASLDANIIGNASTATTASKTQAALSLNGKSFNGSAVVDMGTLGVAYGGTGATTAAGARSNLGVPQISNNIILTANLGGAGLSTEAGKYWRFWAYGNDTDGYPMALTPSQNGTQLLGENGLRIKAVYANDYPCGTWNGNAIAVAKGGTGATTAATARTNLGITPANIGALSLSGGTMTAPVRSTYNSSTWSNSATNSAISLDFATTTFSGWICGPSKTGRLIIASYPGSSDYLYFGYRSNDSTANSWTKTMTWDGANNILTAGTFKGDLTGNVTGNVAGNVSGSSASCTGNAATATQLLNARTINGVSFDGTANISFAGSYVSNTAYTSVPNGLTHIEMPSTATVSGDPTYGACLTVKYSSNRAYQLANGSGTLYYRHFHSGNTGQAAGDGYSAWYKILTDSNYSSYALPLSGGTMTGSLTINNSNSSGKISLFEDGEGGTLTLTSKSGTYTYHMDAYNDEELRIHTADNNPNGTYQAIRWNGKSGGLYATTVHGAVWNDYAEYRRAETIEPGRVVQESKDGIMKITTERMVGGCEIISDTFGFAIGEIDECKTPIAATGRVLAYPYEERNTFELGQAVCAGPGGTVSRMSRNEIIHFPDRIIGTVSEIPDYETWGTGNVKVNGRIWIRIR